MPRLVVETVAELSEAAGSSGMVTGQAIDLLGGGPALGLEALEYLHSKKTGALFLAAVRGGARLGGASPSELVSLTAYARTLGLCFQVVDDLLDVEGSAEQVGKRTGKDAAQGKNTYPRVVGLERSRELACELKRRTIAALAAFDERAEPLRAIANFVVERKL